MIHELFSNPNESQKPVTEREFFALDLVDHTHSYEPGFSVLYSRATWSELDRGFLLVDLETERCPLLTDAEKRYEALRLELLSRGLVVSDMTL